MRAAAGILCGILTVLSPGWVFIGLLAAGIGFLLFRTAGPSDRRFLAAVFLTAFAVRVLLSLALDLGSWAVERERPFRRGTAQKWDLGVSDKTRHYLRIGDSDYYSARGTALAEYVRGSREPVVILRLNQYGWNGYVDLIGFFYVLFGFSPSAVKGINCLLGAGLVPLVFFLAMRIFNREIARRAAWGVALFPSLLFWSASNLKDIPLIFLTFLALLVFIRGIEVKGIRPKIFYGLAMGLLLLLHASLRDLFYLLLLATLIAAAALPRLKIRGGTLVLGLGLGIGFLHFRPVEAALRHVLGQLFHKHIGYAVTVGASYLIFPDSFYAPGYVWKWVESGTMDRSIWMALLKAPIPFFLEPLPGRFDAIYHLPALFHMVLWYGILLLAAVGIFTSLRQGKRGTLFLLFPFLVFSFLMALTSGNVWTLFRVRDLVTPFLIIYAAAGSELFLRTEVISGSRLAAWVASAQSRLLVPVRAGMEKLRDRGRRFIIGFLASPVRNTAGVLITAILVNSLLLVSKNTEWTVWSVSFRLGVLGLGLWALAVRSDWEGVRKMSSLRTFLVS